MAQSQKSVFEKALTVLEDLFAKDYQFALATSKENVPFVRYVDTFYHNEAFYITTHGTSKKVLDIIDNPHVSLVSHRSHRFSGEATVLGHPLKKENAEIRALLLQAFEKWYFLANDEKDPNTCIVQIKLNEGFFYQDGVGYRVDFIHRAATTIPFRFDITVIN